MNEIIPLLESIARSLERIAFSLEAAQAEKPAPNYQRLLEEFPKFDWKAISAEIEKSDQHGALTVIWQGRRFIRRSPENAYGATIFFFRSIGRDEHGKNCYERLITFKPAEDIKVRPISRETEGYLR